MSPRPVVTPLVVSDATALAVVGLTPRQFRAFVRAHGIAHVRVGRRTLVRADRLLDALDRLAGVDRRATHALDEAAVIALAARPRARRGAA